ncbi:11 TM domain-containing transmembrane protein [Acrasis kona]|uniref:11 TM domain-containing transmembrane protein n=1 Tax=Acrasis kona TaxID=1008807 RepID=A0AAW2ZDW8_9EUKA
MMNQEEHLKKRAPPRYIIIPSYVLAVIFFGLMMYISYSTSQRFLEERKESGGAPLRLDKGWVSDRLIDKTDPQWRSLRGSLFILLIAGTLSSIISYLIRTNLCKSSKTPIIAYNTIFSLLFLCYLHKQFVIFPILVALINFSIAKTFRASRLTVPLTWLLNLTVLFSSDYFGGYSFGYILGPEFDFLDSDRGPIQWSVCFNISMCRLISFNVDYYQALKSHAANMLLPSDVVAPDDSSSKTSKWSENRQRQESRLDPFKDYTLLGFLGYVFYAPLYIGGPVTGYNSYISYVKYKTQEEVNRSSKIRMTIMAIIYAICLDFGLHFLYSVGLNEKNLWNSPSFEMTSTEVACTGAVTLIFMYMKFLIIWRLFRLWALWEGVNPPENMTNCIFNNYTVSGFWRSWHRSLYLFIVRYIYVPLGGSKNRMYSVWLIFGFIAVWHDLWTRWIAWALANCLLIMLETVVIHLASKSKFLARIRDVSNNTTRPYYNVLFCCAGGLCVVLMGMANLSIIYGFLGSLEFMSRMLFGENSLYFIVISALMIPFGVEIMLHQEERSSNNK